MEEKRISVARAKNAAGRRGRDRCDLSRYVYSKLFDRLNQT